MSQLINKAHGRFAARSLDILDALFQSPYIIYQRFDGLYDLCVHFLLVVQEPRALLRLWHIRENHDGVVERVLPEERLDATVAGSVSSFSLL